MSVIICNGKTLTLHEFEEKHEMHHYQHDALIHPIHVPIYAEHMNALQSGDIMPLEYKSDYVTLLKMSEKSQNTAQKIGVQSISDEIGLGAIALTEIQIGETIVYAGQLVNPVMVDNRYVQQCSSQESPLSISISAAEYGNIARFVTNAPRSRELNKYNIDASHADMILTANLKFEIWWSYDVEHGLMLLPIQKAIAVIQIGSLLAAAYSSSYRKHAPTLAEPSFLINKNTGVPIPTEHWSLKECKIELIEGYVVGLYLKPNVMRAELPIDLHSATIHPKFQAIMAELKQTPALLRSAIKLQALTVQESVNDRYVLPGYDAGNAYCEEAIGLLVTEKHIKKQTAMNYHRAEIALENAIGQLPLSASYYFALAYTYFIQDKAENMAVAFKNYEYLTYMLHKTVFYEKNAVHATLLQAKDLFVKFDYIIKQMRDYLDKKIRKNSAKSETKTTSFFKKKSQDIVVAQEQKKQPTIGEQYNTHYCLLQSLEPLKNKVIGNAIVNKEDLVRNFTMFVEEIAASDNIEDQRFLFTLNVFKRPKLTEEEEEEANEAEENCYTTP